MYNTILPYGNRLHGHTICVVNRSEVVGRPLAALLANDGAVVYSVDITGVQKFTRGEGIRKRKHEVEEKEHWKLEDCAPLCDVVIAGVPGETFKFPCHLLREGAVCVNFSTEKVSETGWKHMLRHANGGLWLELRPGGQGASLDLRPGYRESHNCRATAESLTYCSEYKSKRRIG